MSVCCGMRTERLLVLLQLLRLQRRPISGLEMARTLGVSIRTVYRDIATLQALGAEIAGEPGVGYVLEPGYFMPPLMLSDIEIEALTLGMRWVSTFADKPLAQGAEDTLAKIEAALPTDVRGGIGAMPLRVGGAPDPALQDEDLSALRHAIRIERKVRIAYGNQRGAGQERTVWPFAIGYFANGRILAAWCETRSDYRHFRTSNIEKLTLLDQPYPRRRIELFREWRASELGKRT